MTRPFLLFGALILGISVQSFGSVIYTFSSGTGSSGIGFTATLPNFLNIPVGQSSTIPGDMLASCSIGLPPGPNFCYSATLSRTATGGDVSMLAASTFDPTSPVPVAPPGVFTGLSFADPGTFTGIIQGVNIPATFSVQQTPEPGTISYFALALVSMMGLRFKRQIF